MKLTNSKCKSIIISYAVLISIFYSYPSTAMSILIAGYFLSSLFYDIHIGLLIIVLTIPFDSLLQEYLGIVLFGLNPLLFFVGAFLIKYLLEISLNDKHVYYHRSTLLFSYLFLTMNLLSLILNYGSINSAESYYGLLFISMILLVFFTNFSIESKKFYDLFIFTIIITSVVLCVLVSPEIPSVLLTNNKRIKFLDSLRNLTSVIAPATVICLYFLSSQYGRNTVQVPVLKKKMILIVVSIYGGMILLLTGSRGTIYAMLVTYLLIFLLHAKFKISINKLLIFMLIGIVLMANLDLKNLPDPVERILSVENDIRTEIWGNALKQLNIRDFIFGRGLNRFQELSRAGGYVAKYTNEAWYAHSVYIDILFSSGIVGLTMLLIYISNFIVTSIKYKSRLGLTILIFTLIAYFTHGETTSINFWMTLALIAGANKWYINDLGLKKKIKDDL